MTTLITIFDVVLVPFPFSDLKSAKKRPCLVLTRSEPVGLPVHYLVCMITSHLEKKFKLDFSVNEWQKAGLPKPSLVRIEKMVTIDESLILKKLGQLHSIDQKMLQSQLRAFLPY